MTRDEKLALLKASEGKIFKISFVKADGSLRDMVARLNVKSYLRGGDDSTKHIEKYINVFDMNICEYRKVNLDTILNMKINGKYYEFI